MRSTTAQNAANWRVSISDAYTRLRLVANRASCPIGKNDDSVTLTMQGGGDSLAERFSRLAQETPDRRRVDLELAVGDPVDDRLRVPDGQGDVKVGMLALELAEQKRNEVRTGPGRGANRERAYKAAVVGGDFLHELLLEGEHALGAAVEAPTCLRRLHAPARAVEQGLADALLERPHLQADRRLGDAELLGRL